ncbi:MAG: sel1 repeat family protein [Kiritimatiellae bacterium]|nr:sel1 repeat family protein [Kiritimatiellia bacterium]
MTRKENAAIDRSNSHASSCAGNGKSVLPGYGIHRYTMKNLQVKNWWAKTVVMVATLTMVFLAEGAWPLVKGWQLLSPEERWKIASSSVNEGEVHSMHYCKSVYDLGIRYYFGFGVDQDYAEAARVWQAAANHGHAYAQYGLGVCYFTGHGVKQDLAEAVKWWKKAAAQGHRAAKYGLGVCCHTGKGMGRNVEEAEMWWGKLPFVYLDASYGSYTTDCGFNGLFKVLRIERIIGAPSRIPNLVLGITSLVDLTRLRLLDNSGALFRERLSQSEILRDCDTNSFYRAAIEGEAEAQIKLSNYYCVMNCMSNTANCASNAAALGTKCLRKAAEQGCPLAQVAFARYLEGDLKDEALYWLNKAADQGSAVANLVLGCYYSSISNDVEVAKCYKKAALLGSCPARYQLGCLYLLGKGVDRNYKEAAKWFRLGAEEHSPDEESRISAQMNLAYLCFNGLGLPQDGVEACKWWTRVIEQYLLYCGECERTLRLYDWEIEQAKWWRKNAEQGDVFAQNKLGICYAYGYGVKPDYTEAVKWWQKAAEQGHAGARYNLCRCYYYGIGVKSDIHKASDWYYKIDDGCRNMMEREKPYEILDLDIPGDIPTLIRVDTPSIKVER